MTEPTGDGSVFVTGLNERQLLVVEELAQEYVIEILTQVAEKYAAQIEDQLQPAIVVAAGADISGMADDVARSLRTSLVPLVGEVYISGAGAVRTGIIRDVQVALPPISSAAAEDYLRTVGPIFDEIGPSLWAATQQELADGYAAGESIEHLAARVRRAAQTTTPTATLVARSAVVDAANRGSYDMALASELDMEKEWLSTPDSRTRPTHVAADGQRVPLRGKFTVGGYHCDHPGEHSLPPAERYNCRCTQGYVIPDPHDHGPGFDPLGSARVVQPRVMYRDAPQRRTGIRFRGDPESGAMARSAEWATALDPASKMVLTELRAAARSVGIPGAGTLRKVDLIRRIREWEATVGRHVLPELPPLPEVPAGAGVGTVPTGPIVTGQQGRFWPRALPAGDSPPGGWLVRDLMVQGGYTIRAGRAFRIDDIAYVIETETEALTAADQARVASIVDEIRQLHVASPQGRAYNKSYAHILGRNPDDTHWEAEYQIADFTSSATADHGDIAFWSRTRYGDHVDDRTFRHETGHNVDHYATALGQGSDSPDWTRAVRAGTDGSRVTNFVQQGNWHAIQLRPDPAKAFPPGVTAYGQASVVEDFAESFQLYTQGWIGNGEIDGVATEIFFRDLFPERAAVLDRLFPAFARAQQAEIARIRRLRTTATRGGGDALARRARITQERVKIATLISDLDAAIYGGARPERLAQLLATAGQAIKATERDALLRVVRDGDLAAAEVALNKIANRASIKLTPPAGRIVRMIEQMSSRDAVLPELGSDVRIVGRGARTDVEGVDVELAPTIVARATAADIERARELVTRPAARASEAASAIRRALADVDRFDIGRITALANRGFTRAEVLALTRTGTADGVRRALATILRKRGLKAQGTPSRAIAFDAEAMEGTPGAALAAGDRVKIVEPGYSIEIDGNPVIVRKALVTPAAAPARKAAATTARRQAAEAAAEAERLQQQARDRMDAITDARKRADAVGDIVDLASGQYGVTTDVLRQRLLAGIARGGLDADEFAAILAAIDAGDIAAVRAAADAYLRERGIIRIGDAGEIMALDSARMQGLGGSGLPRGTDIVRVEKPGWALHREGEPDLVLIKAKVLPDVSAQERADYLARAGTAEVETVAPAPASFASIIDRGYDSLDDAELRLIARRVLITRVPDGATRDDILLLLRMGDEPNLARERRRIMTMRTERATAMESMLGEADEWIGKGAAVDLIEREIYGAYGALRTDSVLLPPVEFLDDVLMAIRAGNPAAARSALRAVGERWGISAEMTYGDVASGRTLIRQFGTTIERIDGSALADDGLYVIVRRPATASIAGESRGVGAVAVRRANAEEIAAARTRRRLFDDQATVTQIEARIPPPVARDRALRAIKARRDVVDEKVLAAYRGLASGKEGASPDIDLGDMFDRIEGVSRAEFDLGVLRLAARGDIELGVVEDVARLRGRARTAAIQLENGDWVATVRLRSVGATPGAPSALRSGDVPEFSLPAGVSAADARRLRDLLEMADIKAIPGVDLTAGVRIARRISEADKAWLIEQRRINPGLYLRTLQQINLDRRIAQFADRAGVSVEEFKRRIVQQFGDLIRDAPIAIRVADGATLRSILEGGRFRTQFEAGAVRSGELKTAVEIRKDAENAIWGINPEAGALERPIYGYVEPGGIRPAMSRVPGEPSRELLSHYGDIQVVLRPEARARSTVSWTDSLDGFDETRPAPFGQMTWEASYPGDAAQLLTESSRRMSYIEAQIHGGVRTEDIAEVVFAQAPDSATVAALDRAGISWRVLRERGAPVAPPAATAVDIDRMTVAQLRALAAERGVAVPARATKTQLLAALRPAAVEAPAVDLATMKVAELRALAAERGVTVPPRATKAQLLAALREAERKATASVVSLTPLPPDLDRLKVLELRALAKERDITGAARMAKPELIRALESRRAAEFAAPRVEALSVSPRPPTPTVAARGTNPNFGTTREGPTYRTAAGNGQRWTSDMGPHPSGAYEENCSNVVYAFEMRMRGYRVRAAALDVLDRYGYVAGRTYGEMDELLAAAWRLPNGRHHGRSFAGQGWRSFAEINDEIERTWPNGARGVIFVGKHIFNVIKVNGKVQYIEAQYDVNASRVVTALYRKKYGSTGWQGRREEAKMVRLDDLVPTDEIFQSIEEMAS